MKYWARFQVAPTEDTVISGMPSPRTAMGGAPDTARVNSSVADIADGSVAVTVIVAVPTATPVTVTVEPDTATVALPVSEELAV
jgi:hypothetical protein